MESSNLIKEHIPLAEAIALQYTIFGNDVSEARSEAYLALLRAADAYDSEKGEFTNFAVKVIRNALNSFYAKQLRYARIFPKSLDDPVEWTQLDKTIGLSGSSDQIQKSDPKQDVIKEVRKNETHTALGAVLRLLSPRERLLIDALQKGNNYSEIGEALGVSKQAAHKTVKAVLLKLRAGLAKMNHFKIAPDGHLDSSTKKNESSVVDAFPPDL